MTRTRSLAGKVTVFAVLAGLLSAPGCLHHLIATGIYVFQGGNLVPPAYDGMEDQRVVVVCKPPFSNDFRHPGAARSIARRVSRLLTTNVPDVDVVDTREVDNWADESDLDNFKELGRAVDADLLLLIELDDFRLRKGSTLYQGRAGVTLTVHDMRQNGGRIVWDKSLGEVLYPRRSGIPAQDKPEMQFQREFEDIVATAIGEHFYKHDPNASFALDAMANR